MVILDGLKVLMLDELEVLVIDGVPLEWEEQVIGSSNRDLEVFLHWDRVLH